MGNELLSPKVIVQERPPSIRTILGVPTAVTAIIGIFAWGEIRKPTLVTSFAEFIRIYGTYITVSDTAHCVQGYFLNGGQNLWVSRTVHYTDITDASSQTAIKATLTLKDTAGAPADTLRVDGKFEGIRGNGLTIQIKAASNGDADEFDLIVFEGGVEEEIFPNLSMTDADLNFCEKVINATDGTGSDLISVTDLDSGTVSPDDVPAVLAATALTTGDDGLAAIADTDFTGDVTELTGLRAFDEVNDIRILIAPDRQTVVVAQGLEDYCEITRGGSMFAVLDVPEASTAVGANTYVVTTASLLNRSEFAAIYWPWIKVANPATGVFGVDVKTITIPPSGHIAGLYAGTDGRRVGGIYDAPAGVERGILRGVAGLETDEALDERKRDLVYPRRINVIHEQPGVAIHVDGSRTLKGTGNFPSVSERRAVIFIAQSIKDGVLFAKHSNNDSTLRNQVARTVTAFLLLQHNVNAFRGDTPEASFFVDVSDELNTPSVIFAGRLLINIGLATQKPAEFIVITVTQDTRELEEEIELAK